MQFLNIVQKAFERKNPLSSIWQVPLFNKTLFLMYGSISMMFVVSLAYAVHIVPEPPANILVIPKHTDPTPISLSPHLMRADDWLQFNPGFQFWSTSHPILSQSELASKWTCSILVPEIKETIWLNCYFKSISPNELEISDKVFPEYSPDREAWPYLAQCFREATALLCNREICTSICGSCC